ncbi:MAG: multicomponent Na+:H+ antiporter subunit [Gaiellaceae bacterium]|nr:multicomponent Na+:H+ antiporter subunit [Gaiellaceae bacterium]
MTTRARLTLFGVSVLALAGLLGWAVAGLPAFGEFQGEYGRILNGVAVHERHATNVVMAINFDYRGFDTMGEEFILFAAVMGVALLLREAKDEKTKRPHDDVRSDGVRAAGLLMVPVTALLGLWLIAHGQLTPGGGFQGGVAAASGLILVYAAGSYRAYRSAGPLPLVEFAEGTGAGAYVTIGFAALIAGSPFLANILDLGQTGKVASAGTITVLSWAVGLEVTAALVLLLQEFLEELAYPTLLGTER